ncbi:hypothetical protein ACFFX1_08805 [Dactylosporangium sucinum]|uniref:DUF3558 domain-containing protein n=1 Tax=Dactylosporangium sucinum TaxID=1424081 RepID=A0A917WS79_9ACTN|nr:hypothetical protein [Dactylosporangium sucinum]GGM24192.1 hypothetical protein GCM10007977_026710 [Dactylosporangium sucinum]
MRRTFALAAAAAPALVVALAAGCTDDGERRSPLPASAAPPAAGASMPLPSPSLPPAVNTDGCQGLITAAQVQKSTGLAVQPSAGDGAAAVAQYGQAVQSLGLDARARMCPFGNAGGDQVTVVALTFPDAGQAQRLWTTIASLEAVGGVGEAALSDRSKTLLAKRGKAVVAVYLLAGANPDANHLPQLQSVANAALAKA